ncbi:hypothetical protein AB1K91_17430 [Terribacillus sp. 179-K 1B1 HS]|uniref:hypothetical protein n=1 Tax=Terribacillus sp. 179-K 1B1 HS TaxID=3142388 RepID=UPI0039A38E4B
MRHREVEVYISDSCKQCEQVIDQLNPPAFLKEMQTHSIDSVPLVLINGEKVHGQKDKLQQLLG